MSTYESDVKAIEITDVSKMFNDTSVVDTVSFDVFSGEIFGLIGPNGAGKTTTIRMIMDMIKPDSGEINIFGNPLNQENKNRIGYLPEERGLYKKLTVQQSILYFAGLKNVSHYLAVKRMEEVLTRIDMFQYKTKKIEELSRGMSQLIQFAVTLIHDPSLVILDEPFANLDPINSEMIKEIILELRNHGKAVILSTHRMNEVEQLCDRILMIDEGRSVLYGKLADIRNKYSKNSILIESSDDPNGIDGVAQAKRHNQFWELTLDDNTTPQDIIERIVGNGIKIRHFELSTPTLHDIFLTVAKKQADYE